VGSIPASRTIIVKGLAKARPFFMCEFPKENIFALVREVDLVNFRIFHGYNFSINNRKILGGKVIRILWRFFLIFIATFQVSFANASEVYPSRVIKLVVPYPAGGGADSFSRPLAQQLSNRLGQSVVVENRGGAGGNISMEFVARAPNDGYTLMLALTPQLAINGALYEKIPFDPIKSFTPISLIAEGPYLLLVNPTLPVNNLKEFLALAKSESGKLTYASSGSGKTWVLFWSRRNADEKISRSQSRSYSVL
jgi:hypothetical protein